MSPTPSRIRHRWAPLLLVAAAGGAAFVVVPHVPREHVVALRLDDAASVTGVDVDWTPISGDSEATQGGVWHFVAGKAPGELSSSVRLPDGRYELDVTVERGPARQAFHRTITLGDADRITVTLR
jgi:hypothetical protein